MRVLLLLLVPWIVLGCNFKQNPVVMNVTHDSHKLIVVSSGDTTGGIALLHHPDCPCFAQKK